MEGQWPVPQIPNMETAAAWSIRTESVRKGTESAGYRKHGAKYQSWNVCPGKVKAIGSADESIKKSKLVRDLRVCCFLLV